MKPTWELDNYKMVDIVKYMAAIMVICIHCNPIVSNDFINYFINQILCRIAVPFFFISSAYFVRKGSSQRPGYLKGYLGKSIKSYLAWSILFIPIGLDWIYQNLALSKNLLPFALVFGLVHVGTYYHLWYIPAMIVSLFVVDKFLRRTSYKTVLAVSVALFLFGSLETYYGLLPNGWFKALFDGFISIFFTTRSGPLFGMVFVAIGFFIFDHRESLKAYQRYFPWATLFFGMLLTMEGAFLYNIPKLDMNFLILLLPFGFFFFLWVLAFPVKIPFDTKMIRELSKYYYFIHTICIVIVEEVGKAFRVNILSSGMFSFLLVVLLTHLLSLAMISVDKTQLAYRRVVVAALLGMAATFICGSFVYGFKVPSIVIKFELVPCLWVFTSICIYCLLGRRQDKKYAGKGM